MVECITLITLMIGFIATLGSIACMFLWNRAEANADRRDMNNKIEANMKDTHEKIESNMNQTRALIDVIRQERQANMKEMSEKIESNMNQTRALIDVIRQESKDFQAALRKDTKDFQAAIHQEAKDFHARLCVIESERKYIILNEKGQHVVTRGE